MITALNIGLDVLHWLTTPIIALAGVIIARQQQRLADIKLRNDVFDRRFKVFEAAKRLIAYGILESSPNDNEIRAFNSETAVAPFFFDDRILAYFLKLRLSVERLHRLYFNFGEDGTISHELAEQQSDETRKWLRHESHEIVARFSPSMGLRPSNRWW